MCVETTCLLNKQTEVRGFYRHGDFNASKIILRHGFLMKFADLSFLGRINNGVVDGFLAVVVTGDYKVVAVCKCALGTKSKLSHSIIVVSFGAVAIPSINVFHLIFAHTKSVVTNSKLRKQSRRKSDEDRSILDTSNDVCVICVGAVFTNNSKDLVRVHLIAKHSKNVRKVFIANTKLIAGKRI